MIKPERWLGLLAGAALLGSVGCQWRAPSTSALQARIVEVPSLPAYVRLPATPEVQASEGQLLEVNSVLRTETPGRLQVQLADGRQFRLGGDAVLRLASQDLELERGQIIAWISPAGAGGAPLQVRTRDATASIVGTTVFLEASASGLTIFSWEGEVECTTSDGQRKRLRSGEQLAFSGGRWSKTRLTPQEAEARRRRSILLNGFTTPMDTLPVIERELGLQPR